MSAVKRVRHNEPMSYSSQNTDSTLTIQERKALSLVWLDDNDQSLNQPVMDEHELSYCAELGYN